MKNPFSRVLPRTFAAALMALGIAGTVAQFGPPQLAKAQDAPRADWREQNAYTLGVQAYLYAFPWAYMPQARWLRTEAIDRQADRFDHIRHLEDASISAAARRTTTRSIRARGSI